MPIIMNITELVPSEDPDYLITKQPDAEGKHQCISIQHFKLRRTSEHKAKSVKFDGVTYIKAYRTDKQGENVWKNL